MWKQRKILILRTKSNIIRINYVSMLGRISQDINKPDATRNTGKLKITFCGPAKIKRSLWEIAYQS